MNTPNVKQTKYTQIIDEKTGEIKYIPENPPTPPPPKESDSKEESDEARSKRQKKESIDPETENYFIKNIKDKLDPVNISVDDKLVEILERLELNSRKLRYDRRLQNGKLDGRRLSAFRVSDRLFKKKAIKHRDYRFVFMMDTSGSMFQDVHGNPGSEESKLKVSIETVLKMTSSLQSLNIKVAVIAMNESINLTKSFDEELNVEQFLDRTRLNVCGYLDRNSNANCGGTSEYIGYKSAIDYCARTATPKNKDVFFVLSDGEPGAGRENTPVTMEDGVEKLVPVDYNKNKTTILKAFWERNNHLLAYGIGMLSDAEQIPQSKRLDNIEKLPDVISGLIQQIML